MGVEPQRRRPARLHSSFLSESRSVTTQLFFPAVATDAVLSQPAYSTRGDRDTTNTTDDIFANHGNETTLTLTPDGAGCVGLLCATVDGP